MSEGPQVKLRTDWLERHLLGRQVIKVLAPRPSLRDAVALEERRVERCFCKGKHIFIEFEGGLHLHNHLLMRGRWRREAGQLLFPPQDLWLGLYVGEATLCNLHGQMLELIDPPRVQRLLDQLGPDAMTRPFPREALERNLLGSRLPIAEFLLDQHLVAGVGNTARSEILFAAGIDPRTPAGELTAESLRRLWEAVESVLWESYRRGGQWRCRVYGRRGEPCEGCHGILRTLYLAPSRRSIYFCPRCQGM